MTSLTTVSVGFALCQFSRPWFGRCDYVSGAPGPRLGVNQRRRGALARWVASEAHVIPWEEVCITCGMARQAPLPRRTGRTWEGTTERAKSPLRRIARGEGWGVCPGQRDRSASMQPGVPGLIFTTWRGSGRSGYRRPLRAELKAEADPARMAPLGASHGPAMACRLTSGLSRQRRIQVRPTSAHQSIQTGPRKTRWALYYVPVSCALPPGDGRVRLSGKTGN